MPAVSSLLRTANIIDDVRCRVEPLVARLRARPETLAVGVLGGGAISGRRAFVDAHSDVDLTLLIDVPLPPLILALPWSRFIDAVQDRLPPWLPSFKFRDPTTGLEINIHQHIWSYESQPHIVWDDRKCEAYAETLDVCYDPIGRLRDLVAAKTGDREDRAYRAAVELLTYGRNLVQEGVVKCLHRGRGDAAADIMEQVVSDTLDVAFHLACRWPPHPKWRMVTLEALAGDDQACAALFKLTRDWRGRRLTIAAMRHMLLGLLNVLERRCRAMFPQWPTDIYRHAVVEHFVDRQLLRTTQADQTVGDLPHAQCLTHDVWNTLNWQLGATDAACEPAGSA